MTLPTLAQIEDAIVALVRAELPEVPVIWKHQGAARPALPYVALEHDGGLLVSQLGEQVQELNPDGVEGDPTTTPPTIGTELLLTEIEQTEITLSLEVFTPPKFEGKARRGDLYAPAVARELRGGFAKSIRREQLEAVGLAVVDRSPVQNRTGLIETEFEGRAAFEVRLRVALGVQETATIIETVSGAGTVQQGATDLPAIGWIATGKE